jgi:hypothetical protein
MIERKKKFSDFFVEPNPTQRLSVWLLAITHRTEGTGPLEYYELIAKHIFIDYKIYRTDYQSKSKNQIIGENLYIVGKTNVRKRLSTLMIEITNISNAFEESAKDDFRVVSQKLFRCLSSFESAVVPGELVASRTRASEYRGKDVRILDSRASRFPWQNTLIDIFYDEEKEVFKDADDRAIYWIFDEHGNVGKSKLVKWLCVNRPDEICKIVFDSGQQLRTSLIAIGPRLLYLIDVPRRPSEEEKIENMMSNFEDLKIGHVVSHMYGKYAQLLMEPPHVIIFSNQKCPRHTLSKDRWRCLEITKDLELRVDEDRNYKLSFPN